MDNNDNLFQFKDIIKNKKNVKPPAYRWQEMALEIIKEFNIPDSKKSSVFKACKTKPEHVVKRALIDTRELCESGDKWRYFFKLINNQD